MLQPSPVEKIPDGPTTPEIAYQMVKDETFAQTQPRLNLATFVTTYMDEYICLGISFSEIQIFHITVSF